MSVYEFDYSDIEANVWVEGSEWGVVRYEWVPIGPTDHVSLHEMYADPDDDSCEYDECTQFLVMLQIAAYEDGEREYSIVTVACAADGSSPNDTPLSEGWVPEGRTEDEVFDEAVLECREDRSWR